MANITVQVGHSIRDGMGFSFHAPCNCSDVEGLIVKHPSGSQRFVFTDAHGNNLTETNNLFAKGSLIKVVLDTKNSAAVIQNADTNGYLEKRLREALVNVEERNKGLGVGLWIGKEEEYAAQKNNIAENTFCITTDSPNHGLGGPAVLKDWATVDTLTQNGWYRFHLENGIDVGVRKFNYAWMRVDAFSDAHAIQTLYPVCENRGYVLTRSKNNSGWTEWAWKNPPMVVDVEYKTGELWGNKHVYTRRIRFSADITDGFSLDLGSTNANIIRQYASNSSGALPMFDSTGNVSADLRIHPTSYTVYYRDARETVSGDVDVQIWYTKD